MKERTTSIVAFGLLALAILFGAFAIGAGIRSRSSNDAITVTGSAKQRVSSDYVIWDASVSSQAATPQAASQLLARWTAGIRSFLHQQGVLDSELSVQPINAQTVQKGGEYSSGQITGYNLTRSFEVRSSRVTAIAGVVEASSKLLEAGIPIQSQPIQYLFTKLPSIRPELLVKAEHDALNRAKVLVEASGSHLGKLRNVDVSPFQVTSPNSTDVSDYGSYDTTTLQKDVTAVVNVTFGLK